MNNDRLDLGVIVPPGDDPPIPLNDIIPAYQQSCHCCSGGSDEGDFKRAMIQTVNAAPGGVIGDNRAEVVGEDGVVRTVQLTGETRAMIADQATRGDRSMLGEGAVFSDDPEPVPVEQSPGAAGLAGASGCARCDARPNDGCGTSLNEEKEGYGHGHSC